MKETDLIICVFLREDNDVVNEKKNMLEFLARVFPEKTRGIAIALASSLSLSWCKNFDIL